MSILTALPGIRPTTRAFAMEEWPQGQAKSRSGRIVKWAQVSRPTGASLELAWENITYAQAQTLLNVWDANYGTYGTVDLVTETLAGLDAGLAALIDQPFSGAVWRSEGPPVAEAIKAKRCTVRLSLRTRQGAAGGGGTTLPPALRILQAMSGVLNLTGGDATRSRSRVLSADLGALELAGGDATSRKVERWLQADPEVLTLTGGDATLMQLRVLVVAADSGVVRIGGGNANPGRVYSMSATPSALELAGGDTALLRDWLLSADPGSLTLTGGDATLSSSATAYSITADPGVLTLSGGDATLSRLTTAYSIAAGPGVLNLIGGDGTLQPAPDVLLHFDGPDGATTTVDSGRNGFTFVFSGNTAIDNAQSKFGGSSLLVTAGTSDWIECTNQSVFDTTVGVPWTVDCWVYMATNNSGNRTICNFKQDGATVAGMHIWSQDGVLVVDNGTAAGTGPTGGTITAEQWVHIAVTYDGTNTRAFIDGTQVGSTFAGMTGSAYAPDNLRIGNLDPNVGLNFPFNGWIDEFRYLSGTAAWVANFTPPSSPYEPASNKVLSADPGTLLLGGGEVTPAPSLLLHFDGPDASTTIIDSSANSETFTLTGIAEISTDDSQFGGASGLFAGGYVSGTNALYAFGTGDFTVDCWLNPNGFPALYQTILGTRTAAINSTTGWTLGLGNGGLANGQSIYFYTNGILNCPALVAPAGAWAHVALTRENGTIRIFVNGQLQANAAIGHDFTDTTFTVGANVNGSEPITAYVDEVRIVKGQAVWTANFTPPSAPYS